MSADPPKSKPQPKPRRRPPPRCSNCDRSLRGRFCGGCGQEAREVRRPFHRIIGDGLAAVFDLDSRAYTTLWFLLTRPAFLSREYVSGRRAAYTPPLRLFLVVTIVLITLAGAVNNYRALFPAPQETDDGGLISFGLSLDDDQEDADDISDDDVDVDAADADLHGFIDGFSLPFLSPQVNAGLRELMRQRATENLQAMRENMRDWLFDTLEYMVLFILLLMPVLALIKKAVFFNAGRYYIEHLVLTLHNHVFLLLAYFIGQTLEVISGGLSRMTGLGVAVPGLAGPGLGIWEAGLPSMAWGLWSGLYLYLSLKNFFGGGHLLTVLQFIVTGAVYGVVVSFSFFGFLVLLFFFG